MSYKIVPLRNEDWQQVSKIFEESINSGIATFDIKPPNWETWDSERLSSCRFVAREEKNILGWATLSPIAST